jgi:starvation-inducible DNA-binding protein
MDTGEADKTTAILQERLASLVDLTLTLKHVHWNVVGPGFKAVHEMMDEQTTQTRDMVDAVAERISTLGGVAGGLATQVVEMRTADDEYALGRAPVLAHLGALDKVYERIGRGHREAIGRVSSLDPVTEDLLIGQAAVLELNHWFVRAHLSDTNGRLVTEGATSQLEAATAAVYAMQPEMTSDEDAERSD